jgi:hypothetical protein
MANIAGTKLIVILVLVKLVVSTVHQLRFHNFVISGWEKVIFPFLSFCAGDTHFGSWKKQGNKES